MLRFYCDKWASTDTALFISIENWTIIQEIEVCLQPCKKAITKLQEEEITITNCHKI